MVPTAFMGINDLRQGILILKINVIVKSTNLASFMVLAYDHLLTLGLEIELVWSAQWSFGKLVYLFTTYFAWADSILLIVVGGASISLPTCGNLYKIAKWFLFWGFILAELILVYRTWAVWGRNRTVVISLLLLLALFSALGSTFLSIGLKEVESDLVIPRLTAFSQSCVMVQDVGKITFIDFILLAVFESIIIGLTWYKGREHLRLSNSPLAGTMYRDSMRYYFYLIGFTLLNIIILVVGQGIRLDFTQIQRVMHAVLMKRLLLNLRDSASQDLGKWSPTSNFMSTGLDFYGTHIPPLSNETAVRSTATAIELDTINGESRRNT